MSKPTARPVRCPFCGNPRPAWKGKDDNIDGYARGCDRCFAWGPPAPSQKKADALWSSRAYAPDSRDRLIRAMLRGFEALVDDHWAKIDAREWAKTFRRRAAKLGITAKETKLCRE